MSHEFYDMEYMLQDYFATRWEQGLGRGGYRIAHLARLFNATEGLIKHHIKILVSKRVIECIYGDCYRYIDQARLQEILSAGSDEKKLG